MGYVEHLQEALIDHIEELVETDSDGCWTDADGILESIACAIEDFRRRKHIPDGNLTKEYS